LKAKDIIEAMNKWAKPGLIDSWDNTGFQIGNMDTKVNKILVSLDLDNLALETAVNNNCNMIISHHPFIFKPLERILSTEPKGRQVMEIIKNEIVVYNAHSNLDLADGGVNDELARLLGLKDTRFLQERYKGEDGTIYGYGRIGKVEEILLKNFIEKIKEVLDISNLILYGDRNRKIKNIAVCGGSGSSFIYDAYKKGADLYITGDIKYHDAQLGYNLGLNIVDAGHYHTEKIILPRIKNYLNMKLEKKVEIEVLMKSDLPREIY